MNTATVKVYLYSQLLLLSLASHFPLGQLVVRMMLMLSPLLTGRSFLRPLVVTVTFASYMASSCPVIWRIQRQVNAMPSHNYAHKHTGFTHPNNPSFTECDQFNINMSSQEAGRRCWLTDTLGSPPQNLPCFYSSPERTKQTLILKQPIIHSVVTLIFALVLVSTSSSEKLLGLQLLNASLLTLCSSKSSFYIFGTYSMIHFIFLHYSWLIIFPFFTVFSWCLGNIWATKILG